MILRSAAIVACLLAASGTGEQAHSARLFTYTHPAMGTEFTLALYSTRESKAATIAEAAFDEVDRLEDLLSNYKQTSELSRINRLAATETVRTDAETFNFLEQSQHWSAASGGVFDLTVGPLMRAWGFFQHEGRVPSDPELHSVRQVVGWQHVHLNAADRSVHFDRAGVELDPGGIGKGFAVDAVVRLLRANGVRAAIVSTGSSTIYALGSPAGTAGWKVTVYSPPPQHALLSTVLLRDESLSSANCSEKNFVARGKTFCHIMDPRTMRPVEGRIHVTIIDPSATVSDALSNVLFVQNAATSRRTLGRIAPHARALILEENGGSRACIVIRWRVAVDRRNCALR